MSSPSVLSQRLNRVWLIPAIIAFVAIIIEVGSNLVANELESILKPYRTVVWVIFGIAAIVTVAAAIWQARRTPMPLVSNDSASPIQKGNVSIGGNIEESIIITGNKNVVKSKK